MSQNTKSPLGITTHLFLKKQISSVCLLGLFLLLGNNLFSQQVGINKSVNLGTPLTGQQILYQLEFGCSSLDADCIGAIIVDTLPEELVFVGADPVIVQSGGMPVAVSPTYDADSHSVTYDFTTLVEMGLPDGYSGTASITMEVPAGVTPNGATISNSARILSDNAGDSTSVEDIVPQATPQWSVSKSADQPIFHDRDITYTIQLCSDATLGNLNMHNITIADDLPAGADFVSATGGGVWNGLDPGTVTWTLDSMTVTDGCNTFEVVVNYPESDMVNNNTGLTTPIDKTNEVDVVGTPVGELPINLMAQTDEPLLPPEFNMGIGKEANDDGILPLGRINYFDLNISNQSTTALNNFVLIDSLPPQFDFSHVRFETFMDDFQPVQVSVEINNSGTFVPWVTTTTIDQLLDTSLIPYNPPTDYISSVEFDFGTVPAGFGGTVIMVVTPAYDDSSGPAVDNMGNPVELYASYENCIRLTAVRPQDGASLDTLRACDVMCIQDTVARINATKTAESMNTMPPAGAMTTGNPYLPGSNIAYTLHVENDGPDAIETDNNGPISIGPLSNPIASDLLPKGVTYQTGSWYLANNTTGLTLDDTGTNPTFEAIDNFNGTGQTLLRWFFTGDFPVDSYADITFEVKIDTLQGTTLLNTFCMSADEDVYCDGEECGATDTTAINNYFGTTADPTMLISGISEMCCSSTSIIVADSTAVVETDKSLLTAGPYAPTGTDIVELGLATDTLEFSTTLGNAQQANTVLPNPIGMDLLPLTMEFVPGSITLTNNTTGLPFSDDGTNPTIDVIPDYGGSGRTLIRWSYTGDFPIDSEVTFSFKTFIKEGAGGITVNDFIADTGEQFSNCLTGISAPDSLDLDGDGDFTELFCYSSSPPIPIQNVSSLTSKKYVKGALDTTFLELPDVATTLPGDSVCWKLSIFNPGNLPLTELVIVDVFPYIGDVGVQLNTTDRGTGWRPELVNPISVPSSLSYTLYYSQEENPCRPEISPISSSGCIDDWTTMPPADLSTVQAFKMELHDTLFPATGFDIDIKMLAPDSSAIEGAIAWNSLARDAKELPAQEPNKVGVRLIYYDLALTKTLATGYNNPFEVNDTVVFNVNVFNQTSNSVHDVKIVDYIPEGLALADNNWMSVDDSTATYLYTGSIGANSDITIPIKMVIDRDVEGETIVNFSEITEALDSLDNVIDDFDSTPDEVRENDPNEIDDNIAGNTPNDEDDHDGAEITIEACSISSLNFTTACDDNGTPLDPLDDRFILSMQPTGTSLSGSYSVTSGFMAMDSISYDVLYSSAADSTFMAVMGGFNITIQDDSDAGCTFMDSIPPTPPCSVIDLEIEKSIDTVCAVSGEIVEYTILLRKGDWDITIEDVDVRDTLPDGLTYVSHSLSQGWYASGTGRWRVGDIPEGVDSLTLTIRARVDDFHDGGIIINKAQVSNTDLQDIDSTPNNNVDGEDDIDFACLSVPQYVCPDLQDSILLTAPAGSTNVTWFRDTGSGPVSISTNTFYYATSGGTYTFTADTMLCPGAKCCPFYIFEGCFDLAVMKTLAVGQVDSVLPGEDVTFNVKVINQGDFDAYDIDLVDYIPEWLSLND